MDPVPLFNDRKFIHSYIVYPSMLFLLWFGYRLIGCIAFGIEYLCGQSLEVFFPILAMVVYLLVLLFIALIVRSYNSLRLRGPTKRYLLAQIVAEIMFYLILIKLFIMEYRTEYSIIMVVVFLVVLILSFIVFRGSAKRVKGSVFRK